MKKQTYGSLLDQNNKKSARITIDIGSHPTFDESKPIRAPSEQVYQTKQTVKQVDYTRKSINRNEFRGKYIN